MIKIGKKTKSIGFMLLGGIVGGALMTGIGYATESTRNTAGISTQFNAVESVSSQTSNVDAVCTSSQTYVDLPGMEIDINTFTASPSAIVVLFNSQLADPGIGYSTSDAYIRLVVDDVVQSGSGAEKSIYGGVFGSSPQQSWNFVTDPLENGMHTVKLQWRTVSPENEDYLFCLKDRSMISLHD